MTTAAQQARHADGTCDPERCPVCADLAEPWEAPVAPAPPVRCERTDAHSLHYWGGDGVDPDTRYRCPGRRRAKAAQVLPERHVDVAWTIAHGRRLGRSISEHQHRYFHPSGNLLLTIAQTADALEAQFASDGWRTPVAEYGDALRHLTAAYQSLAAAELKPFVSDGEPHNGADLADAAAGQPTRGQ